MKFHADIHTSYISFKMYIETTDPVVKSHDIMNMLLNMCEGHAIYQFDVKEIEGVKEKEERRRNAG
jgi:hypothetical protein